MELKDKVVVITGASSGIGRCIALALAAEDAKLLLTGRNEDKLKAVLDEVQATGAEAAMITGDVTVESNCRSIIQTAVGVFGTVDVLVNNAGYGPPASLADTTEDIWDVTVDSCLKSVYLMTRAALPTMLEQGDGTVVQISSVAGKYGFSNRTAYCAAKWGVQGFTAALRDEHGDVIRAYTVNPGAVATPWWGNTNDPQDDKVMERMIQPEEVAEAVRWSLLQPKHLQIDEVMLKTRRSPWAG